MQKLSKRSVVCAIASAQNHAGSKRLICAPSSQARDNEACRRYTTIACMCRREWSVSKSCIRGHNATYARYSHAHIREGHQSCVFFFAIIIYACRSSPTALTSHILSSSRYFLAASTPSSTFSPFVPWPMLVAPLPPALPPTISATVEAHLLASTPLPCASLET